MEKELGVGLTIQDISAPTMWRPVVKIEKLDTSTGISTDITSLVKNFSINHRLDQLSSFSLTINSAKTNNARISNVFEIDKTKRIIIKLGYNQSNLFPAFRGIIVDEPEDYFSDTDNMVVNGHGEDWLLEDTSGTVVEKDPDYFDFFQFRWNVTAKDIIHSLMKRANIANYSLHFNDFTIRKYYFRVKYIMTLETIKFKFVLRSPIRPFTILATRWYYKTVLTGFEAEIHQGYNKNFQLNFSNVRQALGHILSLSPNPISYFADKQGVIRFVELNPDDVAEITVGNIIQHTLTRKIERLSGGRTASRLPLTLTGVMIVSVSLSNERGNGIIDYDAVQKTLRWTSPGDSAGTPLNVLVAYSDTLYSNNGSKYLKIIYDKYNLPSENVSATITVYDRFERIDFRIPFNPYLSPQTRVRIVDADSNTDVNVIIDSVTISYGLDGFTQVCSGAIIP